MCVCVCFCTRVPIYVSVCEWRHVGAGPRPWCSTSLWQVEESCCREELQQLTLWFVLYYYYRTAFGLQGASEASVENLEDNNFRNVEMRLKRKNRVCLWSPGIGLTKGMLDSCRSSHQSTRELEAKCDLSRCTERKKNRREKNGMYWSVILKEEVLWRIYLLN